MRCSLAIGCCLLVQLVAGGAEALGDGRLFDGPDVEEVVLSPDGELVAMLRHRVRRHVPDVIVRHVKLAEVAPELSQAGLAPVHVLRVRSGGHLVEAFLAVPPSDTPPPLVVLPHGGPIGVSDVRHFNPEVQYLASAGLAVLQVNYRGSMGYELGCRRTESILVGSPS